MEFNKCFRSATHGDLPALRELVARYPWFTTARLLCMYVSGEYDPALRLHLHAYPRGQKIEISPEELGVVEATVAEAAADNFLSMEERSQEDEMDEDLSVASGRLELTDDMVTEELAEIYLAQGLNRQAKEIYQRLCLLNREKSSYFAAVIAGIESGGSED